MACLDSVGDDPVGLRVRGISGTVRACEEKYIRGPPEAPAKRQVVFENQDRRAVERGERIDVQTDDAFAGATALDFR
jgi:ribonuclease P/MRP protein subunit POP5